MSAQRLETAAPYFSLVRGAWIPYTITWDEQTGEYRSVEGPRGFASYREAVQASRFLRPGLALDRALERMRGRRPRE